MKQQCKHIEDVGMERLWARPAGRTIIFSQSDRKRAAEYVEHNYHEVTIQDVYRAARGVPCAESEDCPMLVIELAFADAIAALCVAKLHTEASAIDSETDADYDKIDDLKHLANVIEEMYG